MIGLAIVTYALIGFGVARSGGAASVPAGVRIVAAFIWPAMLCYKIGLWIGSDT